MATDTLVEIQYTATDAAGNMAYCKFKITLEGTWYSERSILTKTIQPRFLILLGHPLSACSIGLKLACLCLGCSPYSRLTV